MTPITISRITRSARRTVSLIIQPDGQLEVRAPLGYTDAKIRELVTTKRDWIEKKQVQALKNKQLIPSHSYRNGETFLFLGAEYPLSVAQKQAPLLMFKHGFWLAEKALPQAEAVFEAWYRAAARKVITERVSHFARLHGYKYHAVRISGAKTRWGSCSSKGNLSFTWRLVMAPTDVIDYVVLHELAHLREPNHSPKFWQLVEGMMPNYAVYRRWLKQNGARLTLG